ncbi:protein translocase subunit SecD [Christensenellaceae bacterium OttesenSCG-928-L17]|nr:protein translocase subunit SecD [Christensenellaceae bacterium OttesenSCG-928-L17]
MNVRKIVALVLIVMVVAVLGYFALNGAAWGIYILRPLAEQIPQGLDLTGGVSVVYEAKNLGDENLAYNISSVMDIMRMRLDAEGYPEATISKQGAGRIRIEIPINESNMVEDPSEITQYLVRMAKLTFVDPEGKVIFSGEDIDDVGISNNPNNTLQYVVNFQLNATASAAFAEATGRLAGTGKSISIMLDDEVVSSPVVSTQIPNGQAYIESDDFSDLANARRLESQIRSGALPIEMEEIEVRSVSATLGEDALERSVLAGIIGILLVFVFMAVYYRVPGLVADLALAIYMILMLLCLATIPGVQLTLPGIAGIILSIGMAVDANVVIFERIREEIRAGKSVRTAVKMGFDRAFMAILDSNITTVIAALVLLFFGSGSIKGFATTLLIGIVLSFLTSVFITRGLLNLVLGFHFKNKAWFCPMKGIADENR